MYNGGRRTHMSEELKYFWDTIKDYLTPTALDEVAERYPEFRQEAEAKAKKIREKEKADRLARISWADRDGGRF